MSGQCGPMPDGTLIFIAAVFALAGFVKGVIGLGLPTISMGLLAIVMPPIEAAAILILPSLLTNVWQMVAGPSLSGCTLRRLTAWLVRIIATKFATGKSIYFMVFRAVAFSHGRPGADFAAQACACGVSS
jgi:uncharacterized protein